MMDDDRSPVPPSEDSTARAAFGRWGRWVVYPYLLAVFPIISVYAHNVHEIRPRELTVPLLLAVGVTLVLCVTGRLALGSWIKSGVVAALVVTVFWTMTNATQPTEQFLDAAIAWIWVRQDIRLRPALVIGGEWLLAAAVAGWAVFYLSRKSLQGITAFLNIFAAVLVALPISSAVMGRSQEPARPVKPTPPVALKAPADRPDVYYIVLDGFAREDVLREYFDLDIQPVLARLEGMGFYLARRSTSNYVQTALSFSSSLNLDYLDTLVSPEAQGIGPLTDLIGRSCVVQSFRNSGYKFMSFATGFDQTENIKPDVYLSPYPTVSGYHRLLMTGTPLQDWLPNPGRYDSYTMTRDRTIHIFDQLPRIARDPDPTFVIAHMLAPHPPFVFGPNGEDVSPRPIPYYLNDGSIFTAHYGVRDTYIRGYRDECWYLIRQVEETVQKILAASPKPPIIIIQSDHGAGSRLHVNDVNQTDLRERLSIINAYYFPERDYKGLDDRITPVNSFRVVFNTCFGTNLPRLPDRNYFSTWSKPFEYIDVTAQVRSPDAPAEAKEPGQSPAN